MLHEQLLLLHDETYAALLLPDNSANAGASMTARLFDALSADELRAEAPNSVLMLPLGATEQHGGHLPSGTDSLIVGTVAVAAAERARRHVIVAPVIPIGSSHHHLPFGGTLSLSNTTLQHVLGDLVDSATSSGFREFFILNGHGGNVWAARTAAAEWSRARGVRIAFASYWDFFLSEQASEPVPGHAGSFETSLVLAIEPSRVRLDRRRGPTGDLKKIFSGPPWVERPDAWTELGGVTDDAAGASVDQGNQILARLTQAIADALDALDEVGDG